MRTVLVFVALAAFFFAFLCWHVRTHRQACIDEWDALNSTSLDIYGEETECLLPQWLTPYLPRSIVSDFTHVTELHLIFNDLSKCDPSQMRCFSSCRHLHTIYIHNPTLSREMHDAVLSIPNLSTISARNWFPAIEDHEYNLRIDSIAGLKITVD